MNISKTGCRVFLLAVMLCLCGALSADDKINIAYLKEGLTELNQYEKLVALNMWIEEFSRIYHVEAEFRAINTIDELIHAVQSGEIHFALLNSGEYLKEYARLKPFLATRIYAVERTENLFEEYLIMVKKSDAVHKLEDLHHKRFSFLADHQLYNRYLEYLTLQIGREKPEQFFKQIRHTPTASQAVLDVFFNRSDACLVPRHIFMTAAALNPAITEQLTTLRSSGPMFIPAVVVSFTHTPEVMQQMFGHHLTESHLTTRGQQIFELFQIIRIVQVLPEQFQPMFAIYD